MFQLLGASLLVVFLLAMFHLLEASLLVVSQVTPRLLGRRHPGHPIAARQRSPAHRQLTYQPGTWRSPAHLRAAYQPGTWRPAPRHPHPCQRSRRNRSRLPQHLHPRNSTRLCTHRQPLLILTLRAERRCLQHARRRIRLIPMKKRSSLNISTIHRRLASTQRVHMHHACPLPLLRLCWGFLQRFSSSSSSALWSQLAVSVPW